MSSDLSHILDFIAERPPFSELTEDALERLVRRVEIEYFRRGDTLKRAGGLAIIRAGAAELKDANQKLIDRCHEGASFSLTGLNAEHPGITATFVEDTLAYILPDKDYQRIKQESRDFARFFHSQRSRRIRRASRYEPKAHEMIRPVRDIMARQLVSVPRDTPIEQCAQVMNDYHVSSLLIIENGALIGIVTDRDLRSRVLARGVAAGQPIGAVMTSPPTSVTSSTTILEALCVMTEGNIHHLPVVDNNKPIGMITTSDLMLAKNNDPVYIVAHIKRQTTAEGIAKITEKLPVLFAQWINSGIRAHQLSHILTAISDAVCCRLITCYIEQYGPPPVEFAWLGFGSQGRKEQMLNADQDNGLLIADELTAEQTPWFESLAEFVCAGLNTSGYIYCPGNIMAQNSQWRMTLSQWRSVVTGWAQSPTPKAVMHVSIFFDVRCIYGSESLTQLLQQHMLKTAHRNTIFLAAIAHNLLENPPPLSIFRRFVVERNGEHKDQLDLKKRGILPIVETLRLHALANAVAPVNTFTRIQALKDQKKLAIVDARNLEDALRLLLQLRCEHQAQQILQGEQPTNYLKPKQLSELKRAHLKDAFDIISDSQKSIRLQFRGGMD